MSVSATVKFMAVVVSLGAWGLIVSDIPFGLPMALLGSLLFAWVGFIIREKSVAFVNICFSIIQLIGVIRMF